MGPGNEQGARCITTVADKINVALKVIQIWNGGNKAIKKVEMNNMILARNYNSDFIHNFSEVMSVSN